MRASRTWMSALTLLPFHACLVRAYRSGPALLEFVCGDCTQSKLGQPADDSDLIAVIEPDVPADGCLCWSCGRDAQGAATSSGWVAMSYARAGAWS